MKNLMTSVKNALGIRAASNVEIRDLTGTGSACGRGGNSLWKWVLYHSM